MREENTSLSTTSAVPQGSLLGPLLFCNFINDLLNILQFNEPYLFVDDLKVLVMAHSQNEVQIDVNAIDTWVRANHMEMAIDK